MKSTFIAQSKSTPLQPKLVKLMWSLIPVNPARSAKPIAVPTVEGLQTVDCRPIQIKVNRALIGMLLTEPHVLTQERQLRMQVLLLGMGRRQEVGLLGEVEIDDDSEARSCRTDRAT
eukprot:3411705-Pleurochrysis_carterae.AAC.1